MGGKKMCENNFKEHAGIPMKQQFNGNVWGSDSLWMEAGIGWDSDGDVGSLGGGGLTSWHVLFVQPHIGRFVEISKHQQ